MSGKEKITLSTGFLSLLFALLFNGCDSRIPIVELKMQQMNPTSYEFNSSMEVVKKTIENIHESFPLSRIESAEDSSIIWGKAVLTRPENRHDFYLYNLVSICKSETYVSSERPVPYLYSLHIHLTAKGPGKTSVEIRTINPEICTGVRFPYNVLRTTGPGASLMESVPPSSIEEYRVLLAIGAALGENEKMPSLILPEPFTEKK